MIYLAIVLCSIFIKDITKIFDSVEAIGCSCLTFLFPGGFYIMTYYMHATDKKQRRTKYKVWLVVSFIMLALGVIMTGVALYVSIYKAVHTGDNGDPAKIQKEATPMK